MNEPLTQKQKLIKKINDLDSKLVNLNINLLHPSEALEQNSLQKEFFFILDSLPNRVLAKLIRDGKAKLKELKIEEKEYKREQKRKEKEERDV